MTQITACPQCQTRFRVTPEQLRVRHGSVRCGRCQHIFDARKHLLEQQPAAPSQATDLRLDESAPEPVPPPPPEEEKIASAEPANPPEFAPAPDSAAAPEPDPLPASTPAPEPITEPEPRPEIRVIRVQPPPDTLQPRVSPERPKYAPPPKPKSAWPWALASLFLLIGLAAQGSFFFRDWIAASYPPLRPLLEQACTHLDCRVRLPRNADLIGIETSELNADPTRSHIVVLTSILRNRAPHAQGYPALELTLTNTRDEMVARRIFPPHDYLRQGQAIEQGIPAGGDIAVKLLMDLGELKAEGYRLYLFYPS